MIAIVVLALVVVGVVALMGWWRGPEIPRD